MAINSLMEIYCHLLFKTLLTSNSIWKVCYSHQKPLGIFNGFDELSKFVWTNQNSQFDFLYRSVDDVGNLYETREKTDRVYGAGSRLLETKDAKFSYDEEGNLVEKVEKNGDMWKYEYYGNGMMSKVIKPDKTEVTFKYDSLGRRIEKSSDEKTISFVWDGNTILHEYFSQSDSVRFENLVGNSKQTDADIADNLVTWVFNDGFVPSAKITSEGNYSIISNYLGTPVEAYDEEGNRVWSAELDVYGRVMEFTGEKDFIPFRYQGQYDDVEIGLYYNRFRYYDPEQGIYTQIDPIGLAGGNPTLYGYVGDSNSWIDPFGLNVSTGANRTHVTYQGIKNGLPYTGYASAPSHLSLTPNEIIAYRYGNNFDEFGGVAPRSVYSGEDVAGKHTARGLEQRLYEADVKATGGDKTKVANKQNPVGPNNANRQSYLDSADKHLKANKICR